MRFDEFKRWTSYENLVTLMILADFASDSWIDFAGPMLRIFKQHVLSNIFRRSYPSSLYSNLVLKGLIFFTWRVKWRQKIQSFLTGSFSFVSDLTGSWRSSRMRRRSLWQFNRNSQSSLPAFFANYCRGLGEPRGWGWRIFLLNCEPKSPRLLKNH